MIRTTGYLTSIALFAGIVVSPSSAIAGDDGFKPLFNGKNLDGWKIVMTGKDVDPSKIIQVKNGEIQVTGLGGGKARQNWGYFHTTKPFKNYVIRYSWTYPKDQPKGTTMNSGFLMHIQKPHKVWPHSVEPQGRYGDHGKIFFIGFGKGKKKSQKFMAKAQKAALKPSHEWNTTQVTSKNGKVEVRINGKSINTGESYLTSGPIGFQAEGSRIHFKDIMIKVTD